VPLPVPSAAPPAVRRRPAARNNSATVAVEVLVAVVVAVLAGPLLAGCSALVPGRADEATASVAPAPAPAPPSPPQSQGGGSAQLPAGACQVTVNGPGSVRVSGASSRVITINGASSLSCDDGPMLDIGAIADGAVTLSAEGAAPVRIAAGRSEAVGSYRVTVSSAAGSAAQFVVEPG
jgi:hypothetical protein